MYKEGSEIYVKPVVEPESVSDADERRNKF